MSTINAFEFAGQSSLIGAMVFRYAVISRVLGVDVPKDVPVKKLSESTTQLLKSVPHSEMADRLLFLCGAGVISEENVIKLVMGGQSEDIFNDVTAAENRVIEDNEKNNEDKLPYEIVEKILMCAATSKKYKEIQPLDFSDAERLAGLPYIAIEDGLVKITDRAYFEFLVGLGEKFGVINKDDNVVIEENAENLLTNEQFQKGELSSNYYPFAVFPKRLIYYGEVYGQAYGKDFIKYAKENSISVNADFESSYKDYVTKIKLHFLIKGYKRKRFICGDKVNWFDYAAAVDVNSKDNLNADYYKEIDLNVSHNYTDKELEKKAIKKFTDTITLENEAVIEIFHCGGKSLYLRKNSELTPLENEKFHALLFNFNKIWSIIQLCSRSHKIKMENDRIVIPEDMWNEIEPREREYADRLIKEQYIRMVTQRKNNKLLQSLSEIKAAAETEREKINQGQAVKEQKQSEIAEKMSKRGASTEE